MSLEQIVSIYGWNDWYDQNSGYIFCLGSAEVFMQRDIKVKTIKVPVRDIMSGEIIGEAEMENPEV